MTRSHYKTKSGTELPLLNLRGKEYLQVPHRLVWFREEKPEWRIETEMVNSGPDFALFKATIRDAHGHIVATAHKFENAKGFPDFIEKAETGSVGRALLMIGYGTAFCADELDEKDRLADSPVDPAGMTSLEDVTFEPGDYVVQIGKKYKGVQLKNIPIGEIRSFINWLEGNAAKEGKHLFGHAHDFKLAAEAYFADLERRAATDHLRG